MLDILVSSCYAISYWNVIHIYLATLLRWHGFTLICVAINKGNLILICLVLNNNTSLKEYKISKMYCLHSICIFIWIYLKYLGKKNVLVNIWWKLSVKVKECLLVHNICQTKIIPPNENNKIQYKFSRAIAHMAGVVSERREINCPTYVKACFLKSESDNLTSKNIQYPIGFYKIWGRNWILKFLW